MDRKAYQAAWYAANRERLLAKAAAYRAANPEAVKASDKAWRIENREALLRRVRQWQRQNIERVREYKTKSKKKNRHKYRAVDNANRARYAAAKLKATPQWANHFFIEEAYHLAALRTKMLGYVWHVDHIVPLRSKLVCGLHTHTNLQVIPGAENFRKSNRYWPDGP